MCSAHCAPQCRMIDAKVSNTCWVELVLRLFQGVNLNLNSLGIDFAADSGRSHHCMNLITNFHNKSVGDELNDNFKIKENSQNAMKTYLYHKNQWIISGLIISILNLNADWHSCMENLIVSSSILDFDHFIIRKIYFFNVIIDIFIDHQYLLPNWFEQKQLDLIFLCL